jgi:flap endonuclease-1
MGIEGLGTYLRTNVPRAFVRRPLEGFRGSKMAFDMTLLVCEAFFRNQGDHGATLRDLTRWTASLSALDIQSVFVFDGCTTGSKPRAHKARTEARKRAAEAADTAAVALREGTLAVATVGAALAASDQVARLRLRASMPTSDLMAAARALVAAHGAVASAPDDAERLVAHLVATGAVHHGVSKDYDTLAFGAPRVILRFPEEAPEEVVLATVLEGMGLPSLASFVDVAILAGCDFTPKIPGIGIIKGLRAIQRFGSIEAAITHKGLPTPPADFDFAFARARFQALPADTVTDIAPAPVPAPASGGADAGAADARPDAAKDKE